MDRHHTDAFKHMSSCFVAKLYIPIFLRYESLSSACAWVKNKAHSLSSPCLLRNWHNPVWFAGWSLALLVVQVADCQRNAQSERHPAADSDILQRLLSDDQQLLGGMQ